MIRVGTSHFTTINKAYRYYMTQGIDVAGVDAKLEDGEIHLGPPKVGKKETLIIDHWGRYIIEAPDKEKS